MFRYYGMLIKDGRDERVVTLTEKHVKRNSINLYPEDTILILKNMHAQQERRVNPSTRAIRDVH